LNTKREKARPQIAMARERNLSLRQFAWSTAASRTFDMQGRFAMAGKLRVRVDPDKCQGHARCKSLAPELFELDEFGNAHEIGDGTVPAGLEDKAYLARSNCPELAIDIIEE
jgi:ferredoxin